MGREVVRLHFPAGHSAYDLTQLRADLERFAFLLSSSDGERLSGPAL